MGFLAIKLSISSISRSCRHSGLRRQRTLPLPSGPAADEKPAASERHGTSADPCLSLRSREC